MLYSANSEQIETVLLSNAYPKYGIDSSVLHLSIFLNKRIFNVLKSSYIVPRKALEKLSQVQTLKSFGVTWFSAYIFPKILLHYHLR